MSLNIEDGAVCLVDPIAADFDLPEEYHFTSVAPNYDLTGFLYKVGEDGTEELLERNEGIRVDNRVSWAITTIYEPETTYRLRHAGGLCPADANGKYFPDWSTPEICLTYTTPALSDFEQPLFYFGTPTVGGYLDDNAVDVVEGGEYASLSLYIPLQNKTFTYKGNEYSLQRKTSVPGIAYIYETGDDGVERLYTTAEATSAYVMDDWHAVMRLHKVAKISTDKLFFKGKSYRLVIPSGVYFVGSASFEKYIDSPELTYRFKGASPSKIDFRSCSIENQEIVDLGAVQWTFEGSGYTLSDDFKVYLRNNTQGIEPIALNCSNRKFSSIGLVTNVYVYLGNFGQANSYHSYKIGDCDLIFPAEMLSYDGNESMSNEEIVTPFKIITPGQYEQNYRDKYETHYINLDYCVNGSNHIVSEFPQGRETKIQIVPDGNWKVEKLVENGVDRTNRVTASGYYYTSAFSEDSKLEITLAYTGQWMVEHTSGVYGIVDSSIRVFKQGGQIVLEGLTSSDEVCVYTPAGVLVRSVRVESDTLRLTLDSGVYIVTVNGHAAKLSL